MKFITALGVSIVIAIATPAFSSGPNLLLNPGFEDGGGSYAGWFTFGNGVQLSTPATDDIANSGVAAAKVFGEFTGCPFPTFDVGGFGQLFTPTPGQVYEFSGVSFVSSIDPIPGTSTCTRNRMIAKIVFFDAAVGGNELASNEYVIGDGNSTLDTWVPFNVAAPAPAGAQRVEALVLFLQPGCDTGSVYVDDLEFCEADPTSESNSLANPSFSTVGFSGWSVFGNVFEESRAALVRTPNRSVALFSTFEPDIPSGLTQNIAVAGGSQVEFSGYTLTTCLEDPIAGTNDNVILARIEFRNGTGDLVGAAEDIVLDASSPLGTWTKFSVVGEAPAIATNADVFVLFISPTLQGGKAFIDDLRFGDHVVTNAPPAPRGFELTQNAPNPFNPKTEIRFTLDRGDRVVLRVFDASGRNVATLVDRMLEAGVHAITWDGRNDAGVGAASGVYRYVLETSTGRSARSMVLLK